MAKQEAKDWVLPASIPFTTLKGRDLEECVYWLLDAMGAKDLEWRTGGAGGGAADGGRDLEATFYAPGADGEMESQRWWIECKGRAGTVEPEEVKAAVNNALATGNLDYVVIATNTHFSNPTRDWIKQWQSSHPRPKVKLWDHHQLERFLSKHPDVVLRLFSEALSPDGQFHGLQEKFWNRLEFVQSGVLEKLWAARSDLELTELGLFAVIANEFANGSIMKRPWGGAIDRESLLNVLHIGLANTSFLVMRSVKSGVDQHQMIRTLSYVILVAATYCEPEPLAKFILESVCRGRPDEYPEDVKNYLLRPIVGQLLSEMQDVCSADCARFGSHERMGLSSGTDELKDYWIRLDAEGVPEDEDNQVLLLIRTSGPCDAGFGNERSCPLFDIQPDIENIAEILKLVQQVAKVRSQQAAATRKEQFAKHKKQI